MSHKDWKGPGWYECWDSDGYNGRNCKKAEYTLFKGSRYEFVCTLEDEPQPPEKKLPDGLYLIWYCGSKCSRTHLKQFGKWDGPGGFEDNENYTILGRIPVEPIGDK